MVFFKKSNEIEEKKKIPSNNEEIESYTIIPNPNLYNTISRRALPTHKCLAELIDNSIDAMNENIKIDITLNYNEDKFVIRDNGHGMNSQDLAKSWTLSETSKDDDSKLGKYGVGMKIATLMIGDKVKIKSKTKKEKHNSSFIWDSNDENNTFNLDIKRTPEDNNNSYTVIEITGLRTKKITKTSMYNLVQHLFDQYSRHLKDNKIEINMSVDGTVYPIIDMRDTSTNPNFGELMEEYDHKFGKRINLIDPENKFEIKGFISALNVSKKDAKHIRTYRNNRLITENDSMGIFSQHPSHGRIYGELDFINITKNGDGLETDYNKNGWIQNDSYDRALSLFGACSEVKSVIDFTRVKNNEEKIDKIVKDKVIEKIKSGLKHVIENNELINDLYDTKKMNSKKNESRKIKIEKRNSPVNKSSNIQKESNSNRERNYKKSQTINLKLGKKNVPLAFKFSYIDFGNDKDISGYEYDKNNIDIYINTRHPVISLIKSEDANTLHLVTRVSIHLHEYLIDQFSSENIDESFYNQIFTEQTKFFFANETENIKRKWESS